MDRRLIPLRPLSENKLRALGLEYFLGGDEDWGYFAEAALTVTPAEVQAFHKAALEADKLLHAAADAAIQDGRWEELGIPHNAVQLIRHTWDDERHMHLLGRFDFAGGLDGVPLKLLEFNADTCSILPETAIVQWEMLKDNGMDTADQFNDLFDDLVDRFQEVLRANPDMEPTLLISTLGHPEDDLNAELVGDAAEEAGFQEVQYLRLDRVVFSPDDGIFVEFGPNHYGRFDFWFKLIPWDFIAYEQPKLMNILTDIVLDRRAVILNPPHSMVFQSKALLKIAYQMFQKHELLLPAFLKKPKKSTTPYVKKAYFGREGENVSIMDQYGHVLEKRSGDFGHYPNVFQSMASLNRDSEMYYYQPGVYYCEEPCALSFRRRDSLIIDEDAEFIPHLIR
ncbi:MAG: glutathionylspermidine synthase family protein, partial [Phaeodactylibacter sp.]|nr:glutathionylspermidine synthase family protein [Phaeodactylibacter sp.]